MYPTIIRGILLIFLTSLFFAPSAEAAWPSNGLPVCTAAYHQLDPQIVPDGAGGAIITWYDNRSGTNIYAQRVDADGHTQWVANGSLICGAPASQYAPYIAPDTSGGAIISWEDYRISPNNLDIYAQKVDASGVNQWTAGGVEICVRSEIQQQAKVVSDGAGGGIIVWRDERDGHQDLYARRVDADGNVLWAAGGVPVCTDSSDQNGHQVIADGEGGAIVIWFNTRTSGMDHDIHAQRIDGDGVVQWAVDGEAIYGHWTPD